MSKKPKKGLTLGSNGTGATITSRVAAEISNRIVEGVFGPGTSLREIPLAEQFGVSRGSIREALRVLERNGVVKIEAHRGATVTQLTVDELIEIYQVRGVLLGLAMGLACEQCGEEDVKFLNRKFGEMEEAVGKPDAQAGNMHAAASEEMAAYLVRLCGNRRLESLLTHMAAQISRYTRVGLATAERRTQSLETWRNLLEALIGRQTAVAEKLGRKLVTDTLRFALTRVAGLG